MGFAALTVFVFHVLNLAGRLLHFHLWPLPPWVDSAIDAVLTSNVLLILGGVVFGRFLIPLAVVILLGSIRLPFFRRPAFKALVLVAFTPVLLLMNVKMDATFESLAIYVLLLVLLCPVPLRLPRHRQMVRIGLLALFLLLQIVRISEPEDYPFVGVALAIGLLVLGGGRRGWSQSSLYLSGSGILAVSGTVLLMIPPTVFGGPWDAPRTVALSTSGEVYSFCYVRETSQLFAAVASSWENDSFSHLERFDLAQGGGDIPATHIPVFQDSDPELRQISCDAQKIYFSDIRTGRRRVGVASTVSGQVLSSSLFYEEAGNTFVHVPEQDRFFFFPEIGKFFVEFDGASGKGIAHPFDSSNLSLFGFSVPSRVSFLTNLDAYSIDRHAIYVNHFLSGSQISEVDQDNGNVRRVLRTYNGLNHSLTVDRRYDRLIVSGLWGVEFIDLATGEVVLRQVTEFDARAPVIDEENSLIYVPTRHGRYLYVFDRETMRYLGKLLVPTSARNSILADSYLIMSSNNGAYALRREDLLDWADQHRLRP